MRSTTIGVIADDTEYAGSLLFEICKKYQFRNLNKDKDLSKINLIIVLGGDGFMLHVIHKYMDQKIPFYGINCGSMGFLLNQFHDDDLIRKLKNAIANVVHPLTMITTKSDGSTRERMAFNEVSLFREKYQAAHIRISVNKTIYLEELIGDGVLVSTAAGSSAYNYSAGGPIIPLGANVIALTPLSPFRPRRWQGALLHEDSEIDLEILDFKKRPVSATADFNEVRDVVQVNIKQDKFHKITLLFDPEHSLEERIIREQFAF